MAEVAQCEAILEREVVLSLQAAVLLFNFLHESAYFLAKRSTPVSYLEGFVFEDFICKSFKGCFAESAEPLIEHIHLSSDLVAG